MLNLKKRHRRFVEIFLNIANIITYTRVLLLFIIVFMIYGGGFYLRIFSLVLLLGIFYMDHLDGYIARKYHLSTKFGGVVDVAGDRIVENSLWITFAYLHLVPLWAPLIFIARSFMVDGVRSFALSKGKSTFKMMKSRLGLMLVSSKWSRGLYAISKASVFFMVVLVYTLQTEKFEILNRYAYILPWLEEITFALVVFVVAFCVVRGALTVYDSRNYFLENPPK